jgi:hypothetical protein
MILGDDDVKATVLPSQANACELAYQLCRLLAPVSNPAAVSSLRSGALTGSCVGVVGSYRLGSGGQIRQSSCRRRPEPSDW